MFGIGNGVEFEAVPASQVGEMENKFFHGIVRVLERSCDGKPFASLEKAEEQTTRGRNSVIGNEDKFSPSVSGCSG